MNKELPAGIVCPKLKPCPFCGLPPEVFVRMPDPWYDSAQASIQCNRGHTAYAGEIVTVRRWVGNDKPNERYCTDMEGAQKALNYAAEDWNKREGVA